jgi:uncharacterized iron-regulated membrane protein
MISPRVARLVALIHKWLGLFVAIQLLIWTATGLFMASFHLSDVRGDKLIHPPEHALPVDMRKVKLSSTDALNTVAEDRPFKVELKMLAGQPVYDIRAEIGIFLVSAETGSVISPVSGELAKDIAVSAWAGKEGLASIRHLDKAPRESGLSGEAWAAEFAGDGHRTLYVSANTGQVSPVRSDLWRTYDFFYGLHLMDYAEHENANNIWTIALAVLAVSVTLFGVVLLIHRFTRGLLRPKEPA